MIASSVGGGAGSFGSASVAAAGFDSLGLGSTGATSDAVAAVFFAVGLAALSEEGLLTALSEDEASATAFADTGMSSELVS
jgi:hypothetical protein